MAQAHLVGFLIAVSLSLILTWKVRDFAVARGLIAPPASARHLHRDPLPRLGGVAVYLSFAAGLLALLAFCRFAGLSPGFSTTTAITILVPATLIFLLGLYDDVRSLSPQVKFGIQIVAAVLLYSGGIRVLKVTLLGGHSIGALLALPLTILWVLWITNAFNLIDGLDGLSAGSALFSVLIILVISLLNHNYLVSFFCVALAGAILGFLRFNFSPASIFLGDCGSLLIGFLLSALGMAGAAKSPTMVAVAIPVVTFGLPILDTAIAVIRRFLSGRPLFSGDREHIHHKLLARGLSQRQVVIILYGVSALLGLLSLFLLHPSGRVVLLVFLVLGVGIWLGVQQLGYHEFTELQRVAQRTMEQKQIIKNNLAIRRATEAMSGCNDFGELCRVLHCAFADNEFDTFEFRSRPLGADNGQAIDPMFCDASGELVYLWRKSECPAGQGSEWSLRLPLVADEGRPLGFFMVSRLYTNKALLADINLLTTFGFHGALTQALQRIHQRQERPAPTPAVPLRLTTARAGED